MDIDMDWEDSENKIKMQTEVLFYLYRGFAEPQ